MARLCQFYALYSLHHQYLVRSKIVDALEKRDQWRWGYGMFAIIMPVALGPAVTALIWLDRMAKKKGVANIASSNAARRTVDSLADQEGQQKTIGIIITPVTGTEKQWTQSLKMNLEDIDAFGLILLGFGWSLPLLPFSLKTYADHGWRNQSLIAMMTVGGLLLIAYIVFEIKYTRVPSAPRRLVFNKTFVMAIIIDSFYMREY